jgi:signal transduction histidine kinase
MEPKPRILVIDDNRENLALAKATLEDEDYLVVLATSGEEGLRAFDADPPDCVLLDVRMPGMNGFAVCSAIRALPRGHDTPVLFLTAQRDVDSFDSALHAGADDFLTKPVRPSELVVRVQAALKLRRLSIELREHYDLVRRQRDDLMRLQLQKEQLSAFIVHDLKNPVSSMDLQAQLALRSAELPETARAALQRIRDEARSLSQLIINLLDISRSEAGQLMPRRRDVELSALAGQVVETFALKGQAASIRLENRIGPGVISADLDMLRRVLENLIDNALRHAPEESEIRMSASEDDEAVEIRISDTGPGVPPELREKIFDQFVQLDHGDRVIARSSRGLGLTFCKVCVEAHGGRIWLEDGNPGAIFCLRIPQPSERVAK